MGLVAKKKFGELACFLGHEDLCYSRLLVQKVIIQLLCLLPDSFFCLPPLESGKLLIISSPKETIPVS